MREWADVAADQDGIVRYGQLRACGLSGTTIHRMLRTSVLSQRCRGVYLVHGAPLTYRAHLWTLVLATGGVLGFGTAAHLWGLIDEAPAVAQVVIASGRHVAVPPRARVHRLRTAPTSVTRLDGLPVTDRSHTVLDHLGRLSLPAAARLADRAFQRGWIKPADLERRLRNFPGCRGNTTLRVLLAQAGDGAAAESERVLHRLLRRAGVTGWSANEPIWAEGELVGVADVAVPAARLIIEIDGWAYHSDVDQFQRDRHRQNTLIALGWTVLRFTWHDLTSRPEYVIRAIRQILES